MIAKTTQVFVNAKSKTNCLLIHYMVLQKYIRTKIYIMITDIKNNNYNDYVLLLILLMYLNF